MSNLLITSVVPKNKIVKNNVSQAASNFCYTLIETKIFSSYIALVPINVIEKVYFSNENITGIQCRIFPHKSLFRIFNTLVECFIIVKTAKSYKNIWYYNITLQSILPFYLLKYFYNKKLFVIVADLTLASHKFSLGKLIEDCIKKSNGVICLSERIELKHPNATIIPGIISPNLRIRNRALSKKGDRKFLFSGTLEGVTGFPLVLEIFEELANVELLITGRTYNGKIPTLKANAFIKYCGFLEYNDYLDLLDQVDVCLNFRNPNFPENKNNFPSKLLEYFSYNKVVISTITYPELNGFTYFSAEYNKEKLKKLIKNINAMEEKELINYKNHSDIVFKKFSDEAWKTAIKTIEVNS